jgi:NADPH:quinone reductase
MADTVHGGRELRSLVTESGTLEVSLDYVGLESPGEDDVLVRVEATPINPSDIGLLIAGVNPQTIEARERDGKPLLVAELSPAAVTALRQRVGQSLSVGNEGAGTVVAAGSGPAAQALLGQCVTMIGGGMYADYRRLPASLCVALPDDVSSAEGASAFVNPVTALGMVETMRRDGHTGLVHTAAASNLGQMLLRLCRAEGVPLVCIVRRPEQAELLRTAGAEQVCDSRAASFREDLLGACRATGATLAFDAIGGGTLAGHILETMEAVASEQMGEYSRYGSSRHKQVYIYGSLDRSPTELRRTFGMTWGVGGWLLGPFLQSVGFERGRELRERAVAGLKDVFASEYARTVGLGEVLSARALGVYGRQATGEKVLIDPRIDAAEGIG